jgi:hypothetical protein
MNPGLKTGTFIPTTNAWSLPTDIDPKIRTLLVQLYQNINQIANALNTKAGGYYLPEQYATGTQWFANPNQSTSSTQNVMRQNNRIVVNMSQATGINNGGIFPYSVPHGLTLGANWSFTQIYGVATNPTAINVGANHVALPIPYICIADATQNIELWVDSTNVNISTGGFAGYANYTLAYVVLEFLML